MSNIKKKLSLIDRRNFLTGSFNTLLGLPVLDFMLNSTGTAFAQNLSIPKRYFNMTNGISLMNDKVTPKNTGKNFDLPHALKVLENYPELREKFMVVSNLGMPSSYAKNVKYGPGISFGADTFHKESLTVQLTGKAARGAHQASGPSSDQVLRQHFKVQNSHEHFYGAVAMSNYGGNNKLDSRSAHQYDSKGGRIQPEEIMIDYYNKLTQKIKSTDPKIEKARIDALKDKKSVIDFIDKRKLSYLNRLVSSESKGIISDHLDHIRSIEKSIVADVESGAEVSACLKSQKPSKYDKVDNVNDYSNEYERSLIWVEMMTMAIKCDLSRYGTLVITPVQCAMRLEPSLMKKYGVNTTAADAGKGYHQATHSQGTNGDNDPKWLELSSIYRWHIDIMLRLAKNLENTKEGAYTVLDNTVLGLLSEGARGPTLSTGSTTKTFFGMHSTDNMVQFYATGVKGLKTGQHIRPTQGKHACEAILTAMRAVGYTGNFGDLKNSVAEMKS